MTEQDSGFLTIKVPAWIQDNRALSGDGIFPHVEQRMRFVISLARLNIRNGTGGPFAAAVFEKDKGKLISLGVNSVVSSGLSIAHAEMIALSLAQKKQGTWDLGAKGLPACELVTSSSPCAMCLGAIPWSGVKGIVCGARDNDVRRIGFDEGAKVSDWVGALAEKGIDVVLDICRDESVEVLNEYARTGGRIYNGTQ